MASEIWSASLSGWPSVTDSDVNRVDSDMAASPPLNLPRRQGQSSPQAPGSYLWDGQILAHSRGLAAGFIPAATLSLSTPPRGQEQIFRKIQSPEDERRPCRSAIGKSASG